MPVTVVTDSSSCIDSGTRRRLGILVAPLHVMIAGHDLREGVDEIPDLRSARGAKITTAGASPAELTDTYRRALQAPGCDGVVAIHISTKLSSTWDAARSAADSAGGQVRIVDSRSAGMGLGFAAIFAAEKARDGGTLDDVYRTAVDSAARSRCFIMVDELDHLRRGGRIGTAASALGTALSMKPVLHIVDGALVVREKTRTMSKALRKMVEASVAYCESHPHRPEVALAVHHVDDPDRAGHVSDLLKVAFPSIARVSMTPFGSVLGAHVGPGAIGVVVSFHPQRDA